MSKLCLKDYENDIIKNLEPDAICFPDSDIMGEVADYRNIVLLGFSNGPKYALMDKVFLSSGRSFTKVDSILDHHSKPFISAFLQSQTVLTIFGEDIHDMFSGYNVIALMVIDGEMCDHCEYNNEKRDDYELNCQASKHSNLCKREVRELAYLMQQVFSDVKFLKKRAISQGCGLTMLKVKKSEIAYYRVPGALAVNPLLLPIIDYMLKHKDYLKPKGEPVIKIVCTGGGPDDDEIEVRGWDKIKFSLLDRLHTRGDAIVDVYMEERCSKE